MNMMDISTSTQAGQKDTGAPSCQQPSRSTTSRQGGLMLYPHVLGRLLFKIPEISEMEKGTSD